MKKGNAFLDTSIIISREFGPQNIKERIKIIEPLNKYATTFTKMEINCSLLKDAIFLYSLLVEEKDLTVVFNRLQRFPITERRRKRCLAILEKITNKRQLRLADAITRLESLIRGLHYILFRDINLIDSKTNCPLANMKITKTNGVYKMPLCYSREVATCDLEKFIEENRQSLVKISVRKDIDGKLSKFIAKIIDTPAIAKGRNCSKIGDVIICLEAPDDSWIYSTNISDFKPICKALKKKFIGIKMAQ